MGEMCDCEKNNCVEWKIETREHAVCRRCGYTQAERRAMRKDERIKELEEENEKNDYDSGESLQAYLYCDGVIAWFDDPCEYDLDKANIATTTSTKIPDKNIGIDVKFKE